MICSNVFKERFSIMKIIKNNDNKKSCEKSKAGDE